MTTGIKYCGGCREHYDRKAAAKEIQDGFPDERFVFAENGGSYDELLVICGCGVKCADVSGYRAGKTIVTDSKNGIEKAKQELKDIHEEELV